MIPIVASNIFLILDPPVFRDYFEALLGPLSLRRPRKGKEVVAAFPDLIKRDCSFLKFGDGSPNGRRSKMAWIRNSEQSLTKKVLVVQQTQRTCAFFQFRQGSGSVVIVLFYRDELRKSPLYIGHFSFIPRHIFECQCDSTSVKKYDHKCSYQQENIEGESN